MFTGGLAAPALLHDSLAAHRARGAAYPPDPRLPSYEGGVPPMVARRLHAYDGPPRLSGTDLDSGWTPSSWATMSEPSPYGMQVGGARYTHHSAADSIYRYKRLDHVPDDADDASNDWGLNPFADSTPYLREFHRWAADQDARMASGGGIEQFAYPDRWPGMSTIMTRTSALVPRYHEYAEAPPSAGPSPYGPQTSAHSVWATRATTEAMARGYPPPPTTLDDTTARGYVGRRSGIRDSIYYGRADWAAPQHASVAPSQVFH